jgi:ketosteroid isomerase-like protein
VKLKIWKKTEREMTTTTTDEAQVRDRLESWTRALRAKDLDGLMSHYTEDILVFDIAPPLKYGGAPAYRKNWADWFPTFRGPVGYEIRDLSITTSSEVAFCHSFNRITGTRTNGEESDVWMRATVCFRKIAGQWMITHEHISVPMYMEPPYKAAIDLKP